MQPAGSSRVSLSLCVFAETHARARSVGCMTACISEIDCVVASDMCRFDFLNLSFLGKSNQGLCLRLRIQSWNWALARWLKYFREHISWSQMGLLRNAHLFLVHRSSRPRLRTWYEQDKTSSTCFWCSLTPGNHYLSDLLWNAIYEAYQWRYRLLIESC